MCVYEKEEGALASDCKHTLQQTTHIATHIALEYMYEKEEGGTSQDAASH